MESADSAELYAKEAKKAELQLMLQHIRDRITATADNTHVADESSSCATAEDLLKIEPIARLHRRDLSHARFAAEFARPRRPLIIEGFEDGLATPYWTLAHLDSVCGELKVPLRRHKANGSATWANLREAREATFSQQMDALEAGTAGSEFVFDWPLRARGGCSALLEAGSGLSVPSYFTQGTIAAFGPALFAQGNGTKCGLHVDSHSTHFWQYLWSGQKRWRIFAPSDWARLHDGAAWREEYFRDARCGGLFGEEAARAARCDDADDLQSSSSRAADVDAFDDDALRGVAARQRHGNKGGGGGGGGGGEGGGGEGVTRAASLTVLEGTLRAGEVLFVPAGSPHQVLNEATAAATTMNYVDGTNAEEAARARLADAGVHPKYRSRLRKAGRAVPGSKARWYERFRMPWERDEDRRRRLVTTLTARDSSSGPGAGGVGEVEVPPADDAAFLEPWSTFSKRWWNLDLASHPEY